jgi:hypothetical protein
MSLSMISVQVGIRLRQQRSNGLKISMYLLYTAPSCEDSTNLILDYFASFLKKQSLTVQMDIEPRFKVGTYSSSTLLSMQGQRYEKGKNKLRSYSNSKVPRERPSHVEYLELLVV